MSHGNSDHTHCPDCALGDFARNHYFTGKLLVERDFTDEQRFHIDKLRHHHQRLHGWGVVCGLKVKQHPNEACRDRFVIIEPGTAIDCCGHEILLREEVTFPFGQDTDLKALREMPDASAHPLQICIRYKECPTEEIPVLFDECGCDETQCAPNRILESYALDVLVDPPQTTTDHEQVSLKWTNTTPLAHSTKLALHDATHRLYVMSSDTPAVIHTVTTGNHEIISALTQTLPHAGLAVAVSNDGTRLYAAVPNGADINVLVLDANAAATPIQTLVVANVAGSVALAVAPEPDGRLFALIEQTGELDIWDTDINTSGTPAAPKTLALPANIRGLVFSRDGTRAFSADAANNNVAMVDIGVSPPVVGTSVNVATAAVPSMLAIAHSTAGDTLVIGDETNKTLYLVTLDGTNAVTSVVLTHKPVAMATSPGGSSVYVLERDGATAERWFIEPVSVHRLQLGLAQPLGPLTQVGDNAADLALSESGRTLYVAYNGDPTVTDGGGVAILDVIEEDCAELLWQGLDGCPSCDTGDCVVLATIKNYHLDDKVEDQSDPPADPSDDATAHIARIDNRNGRQLLPSTQVLTDVVECLLEHAAGGEGRQGPPGRTGDTGPTGPGIDAADAASLPPGSPPTANLDPAGTMPRTLHLGIPQGAAGAAGPGIDAADAASLPPGSPPTANLDPAGTMPRTLHLGIPQGAAGAAGPGIDAADATSLPAGSPPTANLDPAGTMPRTLHLGIPQGPAGPAGSRGPSAIVAAGRFTNTGAALSTNNKGIVARRYAPVSLPAHFDIEFATWGTNPRFDNYVVKGIVIGGEGVGQAFVLQAVENPHTNKGVEVQIIPDRGFSGFMIEITDLTLL